MARSHIHDQGVERVWVHRVACVDLFVVRDCAEQVLVHYGALDEDVELQALILNRNASHVDQSWLRPEFASQIV